MPVIAELVSRFTADTTSFDRGQKRVVTGLTTIQSTADKTTASLTALGSALDRLGESYASAGAMIREFGSEIGLLRNSVQGLNRAFGSVIAERYASRLETTAEGANAASLRVAALTERVEALNAELVRTRGLSTGVNLRTPALGVGGGGGTSNFNKAATASGRIGAALNRTLTLPILAIGAASEVAYMQFQASMTKIQALAGVSRNEVQQWSAAILKLGPALGKSPKELADAMFYVASEGYRGAQALDVLARAGKMSAIGMGETKDNAKALVFAMHDYAGQSLSSAQAADVLTAAVRVGNFDINTLTSNLGKVLPYASQLGISFADTAGALATLTREGLKVDQATTALRMMFVRLLSPSKQARDAIRGIGLDFETVRREVAKNPLEGLKHLFDAAHGNMDTFRRIFGDVRGLTGALAILNGNMSETRDMFDQVHRSAGALDKAMGETAQNDLFKFRQSIAKIEVAGIKMGAALSPVFDKLAGQVGDLADGFNGLTDAERDTIVKVGEGTIAFTLLASAIGKVAGAVKVTTALRVGLLGMLKGTGGEAATAATEVTGLRGALAALCANPWTVTLRFGWMGAVAGGAFLGVKAMAEDFRDQAAQGHDDDLIQSKVDWIMRKTWLKRHIQQYGYESTKALEGQPATFGSSGPTIYPGDTQIAYDEMYNSGGARKFAAASKSLQRVAGGGKGGAPAAADDDATATLRAGLRETEAEKRASKSPLSAYVYKRWKLDYNALTPEQKAMAKQAFNDDPAEQARLDRGGASDAAKAWKSEIKRAAASFNLVPSSENRPGAMTAMGRRSLHAIGQAIDFSGTKEEMARFYDWVKENYAGKIRELIYSPKGEVYHGKDVAPGSMNSAIRAQHYNHVHVALSQAVGPDALNDLREAKKETSQLTDKLNDLARAKALGWKDDDASQLLYRIKTGDLTGSDAGTARQVASLMRQKEAAEAFAKVLEKVKESRTELLKLTNPGQQDQIALEQFGKVYKDISDPKNRDAVNELYRLWKLMNDQKPGGSAFGMRFEWVKDALKTAKDALSEMAKAKSEADAKNSKWWGELRARNSKAGATPGSEVDAHMEEWNAQNSERFAGGKAGKAGILLQSFAAQIERSTFLKQQERKVLNELSTEYDHTRASIDRLMRPLNSYGEILDRIGKKESELTDSERAQAKALAALTDQFRKAEKFKQQVDEGARTLAGAFSQTFSDALEHGLKGGLKGLVRNLSQALHQMVVQGLTGQLENWIAKQVKNPYGDPQAMLSQAVMLQTQATNQNTLALENLSQSMAMSGASGGSGLFGGLLGGGGGMFGGVPSGDGGTAFGPLAMPDLITPSTGGMGTSLLPEAATPVRGGVHVHNTFHVTGPIDKRTQEQLARHVGRATQKAVARGR